MDGCQTLGTNNDTLGFCLLPSELIQSILFSLALPEIIRMKLVNKFLAYLISDRDFIRQCNLRSRSETQKWHCREAEESNENIQANDYMFLNAVNGPHESLVVAVGPGHAQPFILRPRLRTGERQSATMFSRMNINDCRHVYGDGHMMAAKALSSIEMWGTSLRSGNWSTSRV
ncbi:hypothetical protein F3Y22_tig00110415pilonHSYRG00014 [Hibiscus syriacus]|uniref:F-box domain-containing protein n=1 Tax=Hibiscus syriacus TaxID=106335 RepID=A0A6A3AMJ2_HIBSY|nr:hypothetical protein F3Y22_tig00110415pilonHSYRG00014 [Hibiscus syriacus]